MVNSEELRRLRNRLSNLESSQAKLKKKNEKLTSLLKASLTEQESLRKETNFLRTQMKCTNYHCDSINQYGRKENADLIDVEEKDNEKEEDVISAVVDRANYVLSQSEKYKDIKVDASDIQRAHRVGKPRTDDENGRKKPRKIICRFKSYKLRQRIMFSKKNLKKHPQYKDSFFTENLTPFRSKLLWYLKHKCGGKLVNLHTRDGDIKCQKKDANGIDDDWYTIRNPDDAFKLNVDIDLSDFNEKYFKFQVYDLIDATPISNMFTELMQNFENEET